MIRIHQYIPLGSDDFVCANCGQQTGLNPRALSFLPRAMAECNAAQAPRPSLWSRLFGTKGFFNCLAKRPDKIGVSSATLRAIRIRKGGA